MLLLFLRSCLSLKTWDSLGLCSDLFWNSEKVGLHSFSNRLSEKLQTKIFVVLRQQQSQPLFLTNVAPKEISKSRKDMKIIGELWGKTIFHHTAPPEKEWCLRSLVVTWSCVSSKLWRKREVSIKECISDNQMASLKGLLSGSVDSHICMLLRR